jgi:protein-L-isoaspartate(D-aspartate) O-methyltransferase
MRDDDASRRERMVGSQIVARGVRDALVLAALRKIPRHVFVPETLQSVAYEDEPLPIGEGQTISQPYIVAAMTEALELKGGERVLEIGTGSGYQTAVLAEIAAEVFTIEIVEPLARRARASLDALGYSGIRYRIGDGTQGWRESAPFDGICVTAAPASMPLNLRDQLAVGGRMIIPVGAENQTLILVRRGESGFRETGLFGVRFVPLVVGGPEGNSS